MNTASLGGQFPKKIYPLGKGVGHKLQHFPQRLGGRANFWPMSFTGAACILTHLTAADSFQKLQTGPFLEVTAIWLWLKTWCPETHLAVVVKTNGILF